MNTLVPSQMIRIVFFLVKNANVDRLVTARIQNRCSRNLRTIEGGLHLREHQTTSGSKRVRILVGEITFQSQRTNDAVETIHSKLVIGRQASFASKTGLAAFLDTKQDVIRQETNDRICMNERFKKDTYL